MYHASVPSLVKHDTRLGGPTVFFQPEERHAVVSEGPAECLSMLVFFGDQIFGSLKHGMNYYLFLIYPNYVAPEADPKSCKTFSRLWNSFFLMVCAWGKVNFMFERKRNPK